MAGGPRIFLVTFMAGIEAQAASLWPGGTLVARDGMELAMG